MKTTAEIGMKITAAQREFRRYTGISAEMERKGFGVSRTELAWPIRCRSMAKAEQEENPADPQRSRRN